MEVLGRLIHGSCRKSDTWKGDTWKLSGSRYMEDVERMIHESCREAETWKLSEE
jgi:hypothetical protein